MCLANVHLEVYMGHQKNLLCRCKCLVPRPSSSWCCWPSLGGQRPKQHWKGTEHQKIKDDLEKHNKKNYLDIHSAVTYIHPGVFGLTDKVKIDEGFEDVGIREAWKRQLSQPIVDWDGRLKVNNEIITIFSSSELICVSKQGKETYFSQLSFYLTQGGVGEWAKVKFIEDWGVLVSCKEK